MKPHERILVAVDTQDEKRARSLANELEGVVGGLKLGLELFTACGPALVREIVSLGIPVFLDLKLHDIPNTVAGAAAAAGGLGVDFLTVHALGGASMIRRAVASASEGASRSGHQPPTVLAVTVLTSHDESDLRAIGLEGGSRGAVLRLAGLARDAGAGGCVCSPLEVGSVRGVFPSGVLVVPGIRPASTAIAGPDDQSRVATPTVAVASGADRIVIGRPITQAADPREAALAIAREIAGEEP